MHGIAFAHAMGELTADCGPQVSQDPLWMDRKYGAAKMSRCQPIDEINERIDKEQPHRREVPLQRAGQTLLVVPALRDFGPAAERHPHRELETEERLPVVDPPAAADHDTDCQRIEPVGDPHC